MHARKFVGLLTVTLVTSACHTSPAPAPTVYGDGMITEITSPGEGLPHPSLLALGPQGEAVIAYRTSSVDLEGHSVYPFGLVLEFRDGSRDVVFERTTGQSWGVVGTLLSETTLAWIDEWLQWEEDPYFSFWDRDTHRLSQSSSVTTVGEYLDLNAAPEGRLSPAVLVGDTTYWLERKGLVFSEHYDLLESDSDYYQYVILATSSDGRSSLPLGKDDWRDLGIDACASTPDRPVLWGVRYLHSFTFESVQIDVTNPHHAVVIEGSGIPFSNSSYYSPGFSSRCGSDLLIQAGDLDMKHRDHPGIVSLESPGDILVLDAPPDDSWIDSVVLTSEWIGITYANDDLAEDGGFPSLSFNLIHRDSGQNYTFEQFDCYGRVYINGDFIAWDDHSGRGPYVGLLTPPTG